jgi:hypothetical protein
MDWEFGYNCQRYLPTLGKCRVLIDLRRQRADLIEAKWLDTCTLLVYTGYSPEDLINQVETGQVGVKRLKNGRLLFQVPASWEWDDCPLSDAGGQCLYFEAHGGHQIACLRDLDNLQADHPNMQSVPSDAVISNVEGHFAHIPAGSEAG